MSFGKKNCHVEKLPTKSHSGNYKKSFYKNARGRYLILLNRSHLNQLQYIMANSHSLPITSQRISPKVAIDHILCPIDFSEASQVAFTYALQLAEKVYADITLVHVFSEIHMDPAVVGEAPIAMLKQQHKIQSDEKFQSYLQAGLTAEINVNREIRYGNTVEEILALGEEKPIDLIVMGTKGENSIQEHILGSITSRVIEQARCPVLAIPEAGALCEVNHLAYALEMEEMDQEMIRKLLQYAELLEAQLHCVHIRQEERPWTETELALFKQLYEWEEEANLLEFHMLAHENILVGLRKFIEEKHVDVIALHSRKHFREFFERSLTRQLVLDTDIPVMTFGLPREMSQKQ